MKTDFLVIGSGAAGLSFALKAAAHGHVTIVTKGAIEECNTNYAQGGICSVTYAPDTFEKHIRDTLICGAGKCDEKAVELVVRRAPELIADLIAWGTRFDKTPDGRFELNREGGHSEHRILHYEDLCRDAIAKNVELSALFAIPARERLGWAKYAAAEEYAANYQQVHDEMDSEIAALIEKAGEDA